MAALVYLRKNETLAQLVAGFGISVGTARACVHAVVTFLAGRAPGLTAALREANARYVPLDGTPTDCGRAGDSRAGCSGNTAATAWACRPSPGPGGILVWISPALAGRVHDLVWGRVWAWACRSSTSVKTVPWWRAVFTGSTRRPVSIFRVATDRVTGRGL